MRTLGVVWVTSVADADATLLRGPLAERAEHGISPADIVFSPRRLVQPDVFVAPLVDGRRARSWTEIRALLLAVEVTSPATARYDRIRKRHIYMLETVDEYWIVDLDARLVERWRRGEGRPEIIDGLLTWPPAATAPALALDLPALFEATLG